MVPYNPVPWRPVVTSPTIRRQGSMLGQSYLGQSILGQTFDSLFGWGSAAGDAIRLTFHGATAVLGYHVWLRDKGFFKYFGLLLAFGQTVGGICDAISLIQRATGTHPSQPPPGSQ